MLTAVGAVFVLGLVGAGHCAQRRADPQEAAQQAVRRAVCPAAPRQRRRGPADQLPADPGEDGVGRSGAQGARGPRGAWSGRNRGFSPASRTTPRVSASAPGTPAGCSRGLRDLGRHGEHVAPQGPVSLGASTLSRTAHCLRRGAGRQADHVAEATEASGSLTRGGGGRARTCVRRTLGEKRTPGTRRMRVLNRGSLDVAQTARNPSVLGQAPAPGRRDREAGAFGLPGAAPPATSAFTRSGENGRARCSPRKRSPSSKSVRLAEQERDCSQHCSGCLVVKQNRHLQSTLLAGPGPARVVSGAFKSGEERSEGGGGGPGGLGENPGWPEDRGPGRPPGAVALGDEAGQRDGEAGVGSRAGRSRRGAGMWEALRSRT